MTHSVRQQTSPSNGSDSRNRSKNLSESWNDGKQPKQKRKGIESTHYGRNRTGSSRWLVVVTLFTSFILGLWNCCQSPQSLPFSGRAMRRAGSSLTVMTKTWTSLDPWPPHFVKLILLHRICVLVIACVIAFSSHFSNTWFSLVVFSILNLNLHFSSVLSAVTASQISYTTSVLVYPFPLPFMGGNLRGFKDISPVCI